MILGCDNNHAFVTQRLAGVLEAFGALSLSTSGQVLLFSMGHKEAELLEQQVSVTVQGQGTLARMAIRPLT